jgi:hypothetical protein
MSNWWFDPDEMHDPPPIPEEAKEVKKELDWNQKFCNHEWKETILIVSRVFDCKRCGVKKEEFDKWEAGKWEL